ncbi:hypothetical protein D3C73_1288610 [compost metagenome]
MPGQKFFNDNLGAGFAEHLGHHNITQRLLGFLVGIRYSYALACGQSVGFDYDRQPLPAQIRKR